jgi:two-component system invasion response regulator UvrY
MIKAIRDVISGKRYLCQNIANNLVFETLLGSKPTPFSKLSKRESEVVKMILQGKNIQEMSQVLELSDKTINTYRYRLYNKLAIKNDVELTKLAVKFNYIEEMM